MVLGNADLIQVAARIEIVRKHATLFLNSGIKDYSQWCAGKLNNVTDALSWDFDRSDRNSPKSCAKFIYF
jgi:hypothetical protein